MNDEFLERTERPRKISSTRGASHIGGGALTYTSAILKVDVRVHVTCEQNFLGVSSVKFYY